MIITSSTAFTGAVMGTGAVVAVAGAAKVWRAVSRNGVIGTAVTTAFGVPLHVWRRLQPAIGAIEVLTGVAGVVGSFPAAPAALRTSAGVAIAVEGCVFAAVLLRIRLGKITGDCGCVVAKPESRSATAPAFVRAGWIAVVGVVEAVAIRSTGIWSGFALAVAVVVFVGCLAVDTGSDPWRRWLPARFSIGATERRLAAHPVFRSMTAGLAPLDDEHAHQRRNDADHFWFRSRDTLRTVEFVVRRGVHDQLMIQARTADPAPASAHSRRSSVANQISA